jgi:hypothetical protein
LVSGRPVHAGAQVALMGCGLPSVGRASLPKPPAVENSYSGAFPPDKSVQRSCSGHAHHALTDRSILMLQNTHCGNRDQLPFDLRHKVGPIRYTLAPGATRVQIATVRARLKPILVAALRPYLQRETPSRPLHAGMWSTYIKAARFEAGEILAAIARPRRTPGSAFIAGASCAPPLAQVSQLGDAIKQHL